MRCLFVLLLVLTFGLAPLPAFAEGPSILQMAESLFSQSQYDHALEMFDRAVDEAPTDGKAHYGRAQCLSHLARTKEALSEYKVALMLGGLDAAQKFNCETALHAAKANVPADTIEDAQKEKDKLFKLSSKKLDWNVEIDKSVRSTLKAQDAHLTALADQTIQQTGINQDGPFALSNDVDLELKNGPAHTFTIAAADMALLKSSDIYIILDHSGSMSTFDCPNSIGEAEQRLQWCTAEIGAFAGNIAKATPRGFTFITFDTTATAFQITSEGQFRKILSELHSGGGTSLTPALQRAFGYHQLRRNEPMLIAIVTDGEIDVADVKREIIAYSHNHPLPNGVFITFLQVGISAEKELERIEKATMQAGAPIKYMRLSLLALNNLKQQGAAYNAVKIIRFSRLRREGLGKDILECLRENWSSMKKPTK